MQILVRQNVVIDSCSAGYVCMDSTVVCPSKNATFEDCTVVTVDSVPEDIETQSYLYLNGQFVKNYSLTNPKEKAPMYSYGTEDLEAGVSELETGKLHFVYE